MELVDDLDGDALADLEVLPLVDAPHSPFTEEALDLVPTLEDAADRAGARERARRAPRPLDRPDRVDRPFDGPEQGC